MTCRRIDTPLTPVSANAGARSYEDFAECFSLWCDEQPENAATIFNLVSSRLESSITVRLRYNHTEDVY